MCKKENKTCSVNNCNKITKIKGFCKKHYDLNYRYGSTESSLKKCLINDCNNLTKKIVCKHHRASRKYVPLYTHLLTDEQNCIVAGCNSVQERMGFCYNHFYTYRRTGSPYGRKLKKCDVSWCSKQVGLNTKFCNIHQNYFKKHKTEPKQKNTIKTCTVKDCNKPYYAKGMCTTHYQRFIKNKIVELPEKTKICKIDGCNNKVVVKEMCKKHYDKARREKLKTIN